MAQGATKTVRQWFYTPCSKRCPRRGAKYILATLECWI